MSGVGQGTLLFRMEEAFRREGLVMALFVDEVKAVDVDCLFESLSLSRCPISILGLASHVYTSVKLLSLLSLFLSASNLSFLEDCAIKYTQPDTRNPNRNVQTISPPAPKWTSFGDDALKPQPGDKDVSK